MLCSSSGTISTQDASTKFTYKNNISTRALHPLISQLFNGFISSWKFSFLKYFLNHSLKTCHKIKKEKKTKSRIDLICFKNNPWIVSNKRALINKLTWANWPQNDIINKLSGVKNLFLKCWQSSKQISSVERPTLKIKVNLVWV